MTVKPCAKLMFKLQNSFHLIIYISVYDKFIYKSDTAVTYFKALCLGLQKYPATDVNIRTADHRRISAFCQSSFLLTSCRLFTFASLFYKRIRDNQYTADTHRYSDKNISVVIFVDCCLSFFKIQKFLCICFYLDYTIIIRIDQYIQFCSFVKRFHRRAEFLLFGMRINAVAGTVAENYLTVVLTHFITFKCTGISYRFLPANRFIYTLKKRQKQSCTYNNNCKSHGH